MFSEFNEFIYNCSGFMHAHVSYLTEDCPACLLMLTVERDAFFDLFVTFHERARKIVSGPFVDPFPTL